MKKHVLIEQGNDRILIINSIYDYYVKNLDPIQSKVHKVLQSVLDRTKHNDTVKQALLKQYFVSFMNCCDQCDQESLDDLTKQELKDDLGICESGRVRKDILQGIQTQS